MKIRTLVAGLALAVASTGAFASSTTFTGTSISVASEVYGSFSDSWVYKATAAGLAHSGFSTANTVGVDIADPLLTIFKDGTQIATSSVSGAIPVDHT